MLRLEAFVFPGEALPFESLWPPITATSLQFSSEVEKKCALASRRSKLIRLTMSHYSMTCPDLNTVGDSPPISPNPDVSGIGVWLPALVTLFAIEGPKAFNDPALTV